jgi:hypothetical protein
MKQSFVETELHGAVVVSVSLKKTFGKLTLMENKLMTEPVRLMQTSQTFNLQYLNLLTSESALSPMMLPW